MSIQPGTACYLVRCSEENLGRVVEVVSEPFDDGAGLWHEVTADWLSDLYPGRECRAKPENLLPIATPGEPIRVSVIDQATGMART
jgi:hypothetical protein